MAVGCITGLRAFGVVLWPNWGLQAIGEDVGFAPVSYTKTGWPGPAAGYPDNYPMHGNFDIILDHFSRIPQLYVTPHTGAV